MIARRGAPVVRDLEPVALPAYFFSELLPAIDNLAELKLTVFCLAALGQKEGKRRYLRFSELQSDESLQKALAAADSAWPESLRRILNRAVARGALLEAAIAPGEKVERFYLPNDEKGRALYKQIQRGDWRPAADDDIEVLPPRPSIYALYEENIGVLTPMIAESLKEAQASYPREWIEDAIRYAVERNARSWRYISKVLEAWQQEGRSREFSERHYRGPRKYTAGKRKDFIKS
ncbi:MAG: DnaD domain protein [Chloroflexi bacterium]|nr:DnaD domain protein [Chloroflexota bacterium]